MGKVKSGSKLLKALGKTKKEQMAKLYPKVKGDIRGKGPYVRGTIGKKGASDFLKRRAAVRGTDLKKAIRKADKEVARTGIGIAAATGAGYALGRYGPKKTEAKDTHLDKARKGAKELIKKQKKQKSDEGRRHDEKMKARRNKMKKHHSD